MKKKILWIAIGLILTSNLILVSRLKASEIGTDSRYISELSKNKIEWIWKQSSFYRDFNFSVKQEAIVDDKGLIKLGIKKLVIYTRPRDASTRVIFLLDDKECPVSSRVEFRKGDSNYITWVKGLLTISKIEERTLGESYPLNFIRGSVMQNISRSVKLTISPWTHYIVDCEKKGETFKISITKYSARETIDKLIGGFGAK